MRKSFAAIVGLMFLVLLLPSCSGSPAASGTTGATGTNFQLLVSDQPNDIGDFYSLNVNVSQIGVLSAGADNWTTYNVNQTFDLTKLQGDNATQLWAGPLTSGNYTKVFIYVDNVTGILLDNSSGTPAAGNNVAVKLPSGKLQISKPFSINATASGSIVSFVFDITVVKAGNSGQYILEPQIDRSGTNQPFHDVTTHAQGQTSSPQGQGQGKPGSSSNTRIPANLPSK